jgi:hypothetical protein
MRRRTADVPLGGSPFPPIADYAFTRATARRAVRDGQSPIPAPESAPRGGA